MLMHSDFIHHKHYRTDKCCLLTISYMHATHQIIFTHSFQQWLLFYLFLLSNIILVFSSVETETLLIQCSQWLMTWYNHSIWTLLSSIQKY